MQIFCDESGGIDKAIFLVAAILIDHNEAIRLMKEFKRAHKIVGEPKGTSLSPAERHSFFDILQNRHGIFSAVVACSRATELGGWAMSQLSADTIYKNLLCEACCALPYNGQAHITIRPDRGTYPAKIMRKIAPDLQKTISGHFDARAYVEFLDSGLTPGVQIADIVANTIYRALKNETLANDIFCTRMISTGRLKILDVQFPHIRPEWIQR